MSSATGNRAGGASGGSASLPGGTSPDPTELARRLAGIAERSQRLVTGFLRRQPTDLPAGGSGMADPMAIGAAFFELTARMMADPARLIEAQMALWNDYLTLWQRTAERLTGGEVEPVVEAAADDRRFRDRAWSDNAIFDYIKQSYLLTARFIQSAVKEVGGLDD